MLRLREAKCDACGSGIDRLTTGLINPVYCYKCMRNMIQFLHEINCLHDHPFGNVIAIGAWGYTEDGKHSRVWVDGDSFNAMTDIYVRLLPEYQK